MNVMNDNQRIRNKRIRNKNDLTDLLGKISVKIPELNCI